MCSKYPGIKLESALQIKEEKIENLSSSEKKQGSSNSVGNIYYFIHIQYV